MGKTILFDFDGTLADTAVDMVAALNEWRAARSLPPVDERRARWQCSNGVHGLLSLSGWGDEDFADARRDYLRRYENTGYRQTILFADVAAMLEELVAAGWCWGIVTNKPRRYFAPIAQRLQLREKHAQSLICGDDCQHAKPHPMSLLAAAEQCHAAPADCIYVGDDVRDGHAAAAAQMRFVAVTWGYWRKQQWLADDAPPVDMMVSAPSLLLPAINALR